MKDLDRKEIYNLSNCSEEQLSDLLDWLKENDKGWYNIGASCFQTSLDANFLKYNQMEWNWTTKGSTICATTLFEENTNVVRYNIADEINTLLNKAKEQGVKLIITIEQLESMKEDTKYYMVPKNYSDEQDAFIKVNINEEDIRQGEGINHGGKSTNVYNSKYAKERGLEITKEEYELEVSKIKDIPRLNIDFNPAKEHFICDLMKETDSYSWKPSPQPHYDNATKEFRSLFELGEVLELNTYEMDILKRLVRCRKKGQFDLDLQKIKDTCDIYINEFKNKNK